MNYALALASSLLLILAFPRFNFTWLAPFALTPMLVALAREPRPWRRFLIGWGAGIVYWFGVCYWIQFVLAFHGGLGEAAGWAVFTIFAMAKAVHMAVFALLAGILMRRWWAVPGVAGLWVAIEVTHGPLGFAWLALGNAGIDMSIPMRLAPFTGVYGVSFIFMMMAAAMALTALRRPRREILWLAPLLLMAVLPKMPAAETPQQAAVLLQPNISETQEWTVQSLARTVRELTTLTARTALAHPDAAPAILVWPEVPAPFYSDDDRFLGSLETLARITHAHLLTGVVAHTPAGDPLNSAILVSPDGSSVSRYDKVNLVPFGEFVPWPLGLLAKKVSTEVGDFAPGKSVVVSPMDNHRIGTFICYESVFPNFVRQFADRGAEVLFNISNDGWFGKSAARLQHLSLVRMRAAENRRWILRATNDGITAAIDSSGRLRGALAPYQQSATYTGFSYIAGKTVYTRFGDWFAAVCASIAILCLVAERAM